ncbi:MAG: alpha/beta fold hydrolase [bacterium]
MKRTDFSIDRFLNIRSAVAPTFSPDGRHVAFLSNTTGVFQVWQIPAAGGPPVQLTFTAETISGVRYSPQHHEMVFGMDARRNERTQLYRLFGVGAQPEHGLGDAWSWTDLTLNPQAVHLFGDWSHDGRQIAFGANRIRDDRFDIYTQAVDRDARLLGEGPGGYYFPAGWSPDDRWVLVVRGESSFNQDLYLVAVDSGEVRHLTPHPGDARYRTPRWSRDGRWIYCASTHGERDVTGLARIDIVSGDVTFIATSAHEVEAVAVSPRGRWLAWLENVDGRSQINVRDLQSGRMLSPSDLPLGVVSSWEFSRDDTRLTFTFEGPRHNQDIWIWDLDSEILSQLTHSSRAGIPFSAFAEPDLIRYRTFDGRMIPAWFYPPRDGVGPRPMMIVPHGGPEGQARPIFTGLFQYFLQHGYGILAPNVRGSSGYGTAYMNLDNTIRRMDSVNDLAHAVYWLRDQRVTDPARVAVYGGSYGGFMVLAAVTNYPDLFAAGIEVCGIANFVTFLENTGPYRRAHRETEYGNLREHRAFLEHISPIHHVENIRCPMMVIHGANDPRVPVGEAEQIVAALRARGIPVEYLRYEDEGHGLLKLRNRLDAYPKVVAFLKKHVG